MGSKPLEKNDHVFNKKYSIHISILRSFIYGWSYPFCHAQRVDRSNRAQRPDMTSVNKYKHYFIIVVVVVVVAVQRQGYGESRQVALRAFS